MLWIVLNVLLSCCCCISQSLYPHRIIYELAFNVYTVCATSVRYAAHASDVSFPRSRLVLVDITATLQDAEPATAHPN